MSRKFLLLSYLGWLTCTPCLLAGPLVVFPQGNFSCSVEVTPHDTPKPDPVHPERRLAPTLKRIEIAQVGEIRHNRKIWSDDSVSQSWDLIDKGVTVEERTREGEKSVYVLQGTARERACPKLLRFDADSVSWITGKALVQGAAEKDGAILHYQANVLLRQAVKVDYGYGATNEPAIHADYQAWIDPKTLLPIKFDDGDALYVLTFSTAQPTGHLTLPDNALKTLKRWQNAYAPHF